MKIHSDILTFTDIQAAVPEGCYLAVFDHPGFGRTRCGYEGSRTRERGFVVRLSGNSKSAMRNLSDKAATWDEWGIFIAAIFERDPNAVVGWYKTRDDFFRVTCEEYNRISLYRRDLLSTHSAPWLAHN